MISDQSDTQLFLLRIWRGDEGDSHDGSRRWHGKVQHVVRGEAHAFTGLEMMVSCLEAMLRSDLEDSTRARAEQGRNE